MPETLGHQESATASLSLVSGDWRMLTPIEQRLMFALDRHRGTWVTTLELAHAVYHDAHLDQRTVDADMTALRTHIWRLRRKLEPTPYRIENYYQHRRYRLLSES